MIENKNQKIKSIKLGGGSISKVMLNNQQIYPTESLGIDPSQSVAGDYVFYDGQKICIIPNSTDLNTLPENYVPIGIVVVPGTHNVYGDGSCGIMSLKYMNLDNPDAGYPYMSVIYWGGESYSSNTTSRYPRGNATSGLPDGVTGQGYLPSNSFSGQICLHDTDTNYYITATTPIPSPYLTDDSRNPGYYLTDNTDLKNNILSKFDGLGDSQILWNTAISQINWKTDNTIINSNLDGYYPAACCCWRYHTDGTQQGDWYLPAMAELCYILPKLENINVSQFAIQKTYGKDSSTYFNNELYFWSSTPMDSDTACALHMSYGYANSLDRNSQFSAIAWLRINSDGIVKQ